MIDLHLRGSIAIGSSNTCCGRVMRMRMIIQTYLYSIFLLVFTFCLFSCKQNVEVDSSPPTVVITYPVEGAILTGPVNIVTVANDNVGVVGAELYVDSLWIARVSSSPFNFYWFVTYWADNHNHTLQVKARDAAGNVGWSQMVNVTVSSQAIASPIIVEPVGNQFLDTSFTTLRWRPVPLVQHYEIQVATAADSASPFFVTTTKDTFCTVANIPYADFIWRIRAVGPNGDPGGWSQGGSFTRLLPPSVPLSPVAGMLVENSLTPFLWSAVRKAIQYEITVARDSLFTNSIYSSTVSDTFASVPNMPKILRLYWRVRTIAPGGVPGAWSRKSLFSRFNTFTEVIYNVSVHAIQPAPDSGFILGGGHSIVKVDKYGTSLWQAIYGGTILALRRIPSGGIFIAGTTATSTAWTMRTDDMGSVQWERLYGVQSSSFTSADMLNDGNFICCGMNGSTAWTVLLNPGGDTLWTQTPGLAGLNSVRATQDGGALLAGSRWDNSNGAGPSPANFRKIDSTGKIVWQTEIYGCEPYRQVEGLSLSEFIDGTSLALYYLPCDFGQLAARFDGTGGILWSSTAALIPFTAISAAPLPYVTDEYIICGWSRNDGLPYLEKFSGAGISEWRSILHVSGFYPEVVFPCNDGGFLVGGGQTLVKTDSLGDFISPFEKISTIQNRPLVQTRQYSGYDRKVIAR